MVAPAPASSLPAGTQDPRHHDYFRCLHQGLGSAVGIPDPLRDLGHFFPAMPHQCPRDDSCLLALKAWAPLLKGTTVAWYADNKAVVAHLLKEGGTRAWDICLLTKRIFSILDRWAITLRPAYLKGIANSGVDALSRGKEVKEWTLALSTARTLFRTWGTHQWDLFPEESNTQCPNYFTLDRRDKKAAAIDAFM